MIATKPTGPYIWRVLSISPEPAAAAFDRCLAESAVLAADRRERPSLQTSGGRLRLDSPVATLEPPGRSIAWPLRRATGVLSAKWGYRVKVELEVMPWSDDATEIGVRPRGHWPPTMRSQKPYYRQGMAALNTLSTQMTEWAEAREFEELPEAS